MGNSGNIACVVLAAGAGTRMKSDLPKVLHPICGIPMLGHVLNTIESLKLQQTLVVAGHGLNDVQAFLGKRAEVVEQVPLRGTGHALLQTKNHIQDSVQSVLVVCGDTPLLSQKTLLKIIELKSKEDLSCSLLAFEVDDLSSYGRIIQKNGLAVKIVEHLNATDKEKQIRDLNAGVYCFDKKDLFRVLETIKPDPVKQEIYLTDVIAILAKEGPVKVYKTPQGEETLGINTRVDLSNVTQKKKKQNLQKHMLAGVTIIDETTTFIDEGVEIGKDTVIYPNTVIEGPCKIGKQCKIGPFARVRPGVELGDKVEIGNFVEVVRTQIGNESTVKHLTYLGDAEIESNVNVGAGTITANFDGQDKHKTIIEKDSQVGSGTVFVAPVRMGKGSKTGAGAIVARGKDIPAGQTVVGVPAKPKK